MAAGNPVTYTLVASNAGPSNATAVTVTDASAGRRDIRQRDVERPGTCGQTGRERQCPVGTLAPNQQATVTIVATVDADVGRPTTIANTASVTSATPDPVSTNNSATASTAITRSADLVVTKTPSAGT